MVDVGRRCKEPECSMRPCYNMPGDKLGVYCKEHKKCDMVDVNNPRCKVRKCSRVPSVNKPGEKRGLHCKELKN